MNVFDGKTILLTGGTGSFGQKFTEILLKNYNPNAIRIFSRGEKKQLDMENKFDNDRLRFFIGDVRDERRLHRAMSDVDIVIHAAALKQVPTCEYNPIEAIRTNIDGSVNIIDSAIDHSIDRVMAISTDKAVYPANLYGATKMTAEKLFIQGNSYSNYDKSKYTKFSCVRYGNVIGSRGSVIPLFLEQRNKGEITVTDERMTRFWITLEQGAEFVINCVDIMNGGEIFVPKIPSMKLTELADTIAPNAKIKKIGIRPGEKLHEILLTPDEARHSRELDDFFIIEPEHRYWLTDSNNKKKNGKKVSEDFSYSSDNNKEWMTKKQLQQLVNKLKLD